MGLAPVVVEEIIDVLPDIAASGTSVLLVEQDVDAALTTAERAYVLGDRPGRRDRSGRRFCWLTRESSRRIWASADSSGVEAGGARTGQSSPRRARASRARSASAASGA